MAGDFTLDDGMLQELYGWIDETPLSRPKKNIARDFCDGVMCAELLKHYLPKLVELHNYSSACSTKQKMDNWLLLNRKVFPKIGFQIPVDVVKAIVNCKAGVVEEVLYQLKLRIAETKMNSRFTTVPRRYNSEQNMLSPGSGSYRNYSEFSDGSQIDPADRYNGFGTVSPLVSPSMSTGNQFSYVNSGGSSPSLPSIHRPSYYQQGVNASPRNRPPVGKKVSNRPAGRQQQHQQQLHAAGDMIGKSQSMSNLARDIDPELISPQVQFVLEEKQQALLASQETVQILHAKIRRLEHLIHLKDVRVQELTSRLQNYEHTVYPQ